MRDGPAAGQAGREETDYAPGNEKKQPKGRSSISIFSVSLTESGCSTRRRRGVARSNVSLSGLSPCRASCHVSITANQTPPTRVGTTSSERAGHHNGLSSETCCQPWTAPCCRSSAQLKGRRSVAIMQPAERADLYQICGFARSAIYVA